VLFAPQSFDSSRIPAQNVDLHNLQTAPKPAQNK